MQTSINSLDIHTSMDIQEMDHLIYDRAFNHEYAAVYGDWFDILTVNYQQIKALKNCVVYHTII